MNTPTLENNRVKLIPLNIENYKHLIDLAQQENLVKYSPSKIDNPEDLKKYVQNALDTLTNKTAMPFIIFDKLSNSYAGYTRFGLIDWHNKVLHIGWTWIGHEFQDTRLDKQMKFLMPNMFLKP